MPCCDKLSSPNFSQKLQSKPTTKLKHLKMKIQASVVWCTCRSFGNFHQLFRAEPKTRRNQRISQCLAHATLSGMVTTTALKWWPVSPFQPSSNWTTQSNEIHRLINTCSLSQMIFPPGEMLPIHLSRLGWCTQTKLNYSLDCPDELLALRELDVDEDEEESDAAVLGPALGQQTLQ